MLIIFWAWNPISCEHISFWRLVLDPHLPTYHSNIGVYIIAMLEFDTSTLPFLVLEQFLWCKAANYSCWGLICVRDIWIGILNWADYFGGWQWSPRCLFPASKKWSLHSNGLVEIAAPWLLNTKSTSVAQFWSLMWLSCYSAEGVKGERRRVQEVLKNKLSGRWNII